MLSTYTLMTLCTLLPVGANDLAISNVRLTFGALGPTRQDGKILPGDTLFVSYDIEGMTVDDDGTIHFSSEVVLVDGKGKEIFRQLPKEDEATNALGGGTMQGFVEVDIGLEHPPGECSLKVTVNDLTSKKSQSFTKKLDVSQPGFGLVGVATTADADGKAPITAFGLGQVLWINAAVVGYTMDKSKKQPNLSFELTILDENGKPTLKKPFTGTVDKDVPDDANSVPIQFSLLLNRAGKYTAVLKAKDALGKGESTQKIPLVVIGGGK
jgi:hypothetical protein